MTVGRETGEQETVHLFCEQRRTERHGVLVGASREGGQHRGWRGSDRVDRVRRASSRGGTSNNRRLVTDHASGHISKCIRADGSQGLVQRVGT